MEKLCFSPFFFFSFSGSNTNSISNSNIISSNIWISSTSSNSISVAVATTVVVKIFSSSSLSVLIAFLWNLPICCSSETPQSLLHSLHLAFKFFIESWYALHSGKHSPSIYDTPAPVVYLINNNFKKQLS